MNFSVLSQFVDSSKIGGWVRAGVASLLGVLISKWPWLSTFLDPATQAALGVAVSGIVVAIWSQLTKTDAAKIAAVVELAKDPASPVQAVITTNTDAGKALAASISGPIESAGSTAATAIAKT